MRFLRLVPLFAVAAFAADYAAEGRLWWTHIQFLADDQLEGRSVGTPGFQKAVQYVETGKQADEFDAFIERAGRQHLRVTRPDNQAGDNNREPNPGIRAS